MFPRITVGTHTITCTATGGNGKSAFSTKTFLVDLAEPPSELINSNEVKEICGGYRYQTPNPKNYILFNDEKWRILGFIDGRLKIVDPTRYEFKTSATDCGYFNRTDLWAYLNGSYWDSLSENAKLMVDQNSHWGSTSVKLTYKSDLFSRYSCEEVLGYEKNSSIDGKVGILEVSDLLGNSGSSFNTNEYGIFHWLNEIWSMGAYNNENHCDYHKLIQIKQNDYSWYEFLALSDNARYLFYSYPVVYLRSNVRITSGDGTYDNPFEIEVQ